MFYGHILHRISREILFIVLIHQLICNTHYVAFPVGRVTGRIQDFIEGGAALVVVETFFYGGEGRGGLRVLPNKTKCNFRLWMVHSVAYLDYI